MAIEGMETGAFGGSDANSFLESENHARDVNPFPIVSGWDIFRNSIAGFTENDGPQQSFNDLTGPVLAVDGQHVELVGDDSIPFPDAPPANPWTVPSEFGDLRITTAAPWQVMTQAQYENINGQPDPQGVGLDEFHHVNEWGNNLAFTARLIALVRPGIYNCAAGLTVSAIDRHGQLQTIDGSMTCWLISADLSQVIHFTPAGKNSLSQADGLVGSVVNSPLLFERQTAFFVEVRMTTVSKQAWLSDLLVAGPSISNFPSLSYAPSFFGGG